MSTPQGFADRAGSVVETLTVTALSAAAAILAFHLVNRIGAPQQAATPSDLDIVALQSRVLNAAGRSGIDVNDLGGGIVELVGESTDDQEVVRLIASITGAPGVDVVLDRLWVRTPRLVS